MPDQKIIIVAVEDDGHRRWKVELDLNRDRLERLFLLPLIDGADFDSMRDAASAVADALVRDTAAETVRH